MQKCYHRFLFASPARIRIFFEAHTKFNESSQPFANPGATFFFCAPSILRMTTSHPQYHLSHPSPSTQTVDTQVPSPKNVQTQHDQQCLRERYEQAEDDCLSPLDPHTPPSLGNPGAMGIKKISTAVKPTTTTSEQVQQRFNSNSESKIIFFDFLDVLRFSKKIYNGIMYFSISSIQDGKGNLQSRRE